MHTRILPPRGSSETRLIGPLESGRPGRRLALALTACLAAGLLMAGECAPTDDGSDGGEAPTTTQVTLYTNLGKIVIQLFPEQAPQAVAKFLELVDDQSYYDGKIFHDANSGFLVAGAYRLNLTDGGEIEPINESNNGLKNIRGRVAFYGPTDGTEDTVKPQFLINLTANPDLDYTLGSTDTPPFTVIGRVTLGMDIADDIAALDTTTGTSSGGDSLGSIPQTDIGHKVRIIRATSSEEELGENTAPTAAATAPTAVEPGESVSLDGTDSTDADGDPLAYEWELTSESEDALAALDITLTLDNANKAAAKFTAPTPSSPVDVAFRFTVRDDRGGSDSTTVPITLGDNISPKARAGSDKTAHPGDTVQLDGSGSTDSDSDDNLTYAWALTAESQQLLNDRSLPIPAAGTTAKYSFTAPLVTSPVPLTFELTVTDNEGAEATDTVEVRVLPMAFNPAVSYTLGGTPVAIARGDLNNDDLPDLAIANSGSSTVAVMLNDGDGTLQAAVTYPVGSSPQSIVVTDLNDDDRPDIATANASDDTLSVLINNGDGTFAAATTFAMGSGPVSLSSANFDNASGPDLAAVNTTAAGNNSLAVLTNDGLGDFTTGNGNLVFTGLVDETVITPAGARVLAAGNIDGDGLADLAVAYDDRKVFILVGDSSKAEGFSYKTHFESGPTGVTNPRAIALAEVTEDSNLDLVLVLEAIDKVSVRKSSGSGQFAFEALYDTGSSPSAVAAGDFDGDGDTDLAVANEDDDDVSVFQNKGTGSFKAKADFELAAADEGPMGIVSADFNDDGVDDLAVANGASGTVTILLSLTVSADAGEDQNVLVNETVTLHGSAKSRDGATFTYKWVQTAGETVTLSSTTAAEPTFTAPATTGQLVFRLTATDDQGATANDTVIVDVFIETASGLWYSDKVEGTGALIESTDTISVLYTGRLSNRAGDTFDTTETDGQPRQFALSNLIEGWQEGLANHGMRVGGTRILIIPPDLGYGASASNPDIPPNSTLWFELEVTGVE